MRYVSMLILTLALMASACAPGTTENLGNIPLIGSYLVKGAELAGKGKQLVIDTVEPEACLQPGEYTGVLLRPTIVGENGEEIAPADKTYPPDVAEAFETIRNYRCSNRLPEGQYFVKP